MKLLLGLALASFVTGCVEGADDDPALDVTAQAVVMPGFEIVEAETFVDSASVKQLQLECPAGKVALGAGWEGLDPTHAFIHAVATYSAPSYDGHSWLLNARNVSPWARDWSLHLEVACATPPRSYQIVTADSTFGQVAPACPRGKVTTGGGFGVLDSTDAILDGALGYFEPGWDGSGWLINAHPTTPVVGSKLRGFAICASPKHLPGYQVVSTSSVLDPISYKQVIAGCPPSTVAMGAGWAVLDATGAIMDGAALHHAWYGAGGWLTNAESNVGGVDWTLRVRMLCVE